MIFAGCTSGTGGQIELMVPGPEVREASHVLGSFCPRLDRDLAEVKVLEVGEPDSARPLLSSSIRRAVLTADDPGVALSHLRVHHPKARVLAISGGLTEALYWSALMGQGTVYSLGARVYDKEARDALRLGQRLLPLHEVDLKTAALSAVEESEEFPLWVSLNLDVLKPHLVPGVSPVGPGGASLEALRAALEAIPGRRVVGFEVTGYPEQENRNPFIALTAAELLRDNILTWWGDLGEDIP